MSEDKETKKSSRTEIKVARDKYIIREGYGMWIARKKKAKNGDAWERLSGFCTTYDSLLDSYVREMSRQTAGDTVVEHLKAFKQLEKEVRSIAQKAGAELEAKREEE